MPTSMMGIMLMAVVGTAHPTLLGGFERPGRSSAIRFPSLSAGAWALLESSGTRPLAESE